jgi:lipid II:glycine glycyltransferase (peptidoglycan interpeptide bridge formation enzyme)
LDKLAIAGALCFYAQKHAVYWHGAALQSHFSLRPVNLLMSEIIRHACEEGHQWFDLNPSGGHPGVKKFKESLGAQALKAPVINFHRGSGALPNTITSLRKAIR